jgi:hypothetical protein
MAIDYRRMRATATRLLTENGKAYQLTRGGTTTAISTGKRSPPACYRDRHRRYHRIFTREIDGSLIATGDKKLAATFETEVRIDDRIEIDGKNGAWCSRIRLSPDVLISTTSS